MFKDSDCKSDICRGWIEGVLDEGSRMDCSLEPREGVSSEFDLLDRLMLRSRFVHVYVCSFKISCVLLLGHRDWLGCLELFLIEQTAGRPACVEIIPRPGDDH